VLPKSVHPEYIQQHAPGALLGWELTAAHMEQLDQMEDGHKYCWDASMIV
jgi:diketogulonate reductase-like aldo/keto reductase